MNTSINELIHISNAVGKDITLIQGGGGNTSVKTDSTMYIKASGTALVEMSETAGWISVNRSTGETMAEGNGRPSMEWPMHLSLPTYAIHTHSVYVNVWNCQEGGEETLLNIADEYDPSFIPYVHPGNALGYSITEAISQRTSTLPPRVFFLGNHGMITCGETAEEALQLTHTINELAKQAVLAALPDGVPFEQQDHSLASAPTQCLFPDAAVFTDANASEVSEGMQNIFAANDFMLQSITAMGGTVRSLTEQDIDDIRNMESEQYRIQLNK